MYDEEETMKPLFTIRIAAAESGVHPQTLRLYESRGLINPQRSDGNTRLYSRFDLDRISHIVELSSLGINSAGIEQILELEDRIEILEKQLSKEKSDNRTLKQMLKEKSEPRSCPQNHAIILVRRGQ